MRSFALLLLLAHTNLAADWAQFGGPKRDFTINPGDLPSAWPEQGPKVLWKRPLGDGYSGISVTGGVLYTMYEKRDGDSVIAMDAKNGKTLWEHELSRKTGKSLDLSQGPGPHSTPLIVKALSAELRLKKPEAALKHFQQALDAFPKGERAEDARFGLARLDQTPRAV